jgi:hypothetical protein
MADPSAAIQLVRGFHQVEGNAWRWTAGRFSITLATPPNSAARGAKLTLQLSVPDAVLTRVGPVTLTAFINNAALRSETWKTAGERVFSAEIPASALREEAVTLDFTLDRFLAAGTVDTRELGLIVSRVALQTL